MLFAENYVYGFLTKNYADVRIIRFSKKLKYSLTKFMLDVLFVNVCGYHESMLLIR